MENNLSTDTTLAEEKRRLAFLASRRSLLELDLLFTTFLKHYLPALDHRGCRHFSRLLTYPDLEIIDWITGIKPLPAEIDPTLIKLFHICLKANKDSAKKEIT